MPWKIFCPRPTLEHGWCQAISVRIAAQQYEEACIPIRVINEIKLSVILRKGIKAACYWVWQRFRRYFVACERLQCGKPRFSWRLLGDLNFHTVIIYFKFA